MNDNKICPFRMIAGAIRSCNAYCVKDRCAWWREYQFNDLADRSDGCCAVLEIARCVDSLDFLRP